MASDAARLSVPVPRMLPVVVSKELHGAGGRSVRGVGGANGGCKGQRIGRTQMNG